MKQMESATPPDTEGEAAAQRVTLTWVVQHGAVYSSADPAALLARHLAFLLELRDGGQLIVAGGYTFAERDPAGLDSGGMYVIRAATEAEAQAIARRDPFHEAGAPVLVRPWRRVL